MNAIDVDGDAPELVRRALFEQRLVLNATGPATIRLLPPLIVRPTSSTTRSRASAGCWRGRRVTFAAPRMTETDHTEVHRIAAAPARTASYEADPARSAACCCSTPAASTRA